MPNIPLNPSIIDSTIAGVRVATTKSAGNIGVIFNNVMSHEHQAQLIYKVVFIHICNL